MTTTIEAITTTYVTYQTDDNHNGGYERYSITDEYALALKQNQIMNDGVLADPDDK